MSPKNPYIARKQANKFTEDIKEAINQPQDSPLLFYAYGIGGIGKSTLINKLIETFSPQFQCPKVSFGINSLINSPLDLMKAFNNRVKGDVSGWDIDPFGELLDKREQTAHRLASESIEGNANENKPNKEEILKKLGTVVKVGATIGSIFTSSGTATAAANAGGSLLQAGIDKGVDSLVEGATASIDIVDLVKKHRATKDDVELQELITNPLPKLAQAFIQTLIQKSQQQPILLFVDTYEKAASEFDTFFCRFLLSNRELKQAAVRIVMVGRYSLSNSRYQRMFQQSEIYKSERQLDKFNQEETKAYLSEIGITKPRDINKFWKATKGYPYYLNLIREQKENGKEIRLSRGGKDMVDLLLDGFSDTEKKVIRLAAYCRWFDRSIIKYLIEQNNIEQGLEHSWFDWLANRDFTIEESYYCFDDVARDVIRQAEHNYDKRNFAQIH